MNGWSSTANSGVRRGNCAGLLAFRATKHGVVKDLATYTPGAVVQPGAVLLNIVPRDEPLFAEERGRRLHRAEGEREGETPHAFQKYGMLEGRIELVSADSLANDPQRVAAQGQSPQICKALVRLAGQELRPPGGEPLKLAPGMVVQAGIHQGRRTVLEYLLSPVQKVAMEAARER